MSSSSEKEVGDTTFSNEELKSIIDHTFETICSIWIDVYGENDSKKQSRIDCIKKQLVTFCEDLVQQEQERKDTLISRVEESLERQSQMEKILKLDKKLDNVCYDDGPLVEVDMRLLNILDKYKIIEESRLEKLASLQSKEASLCSFLDKPVEKIVLENGAVPSESELETYTKKIQKLEQEKIELIDTFSTTKAELASLLKELDIPPLSKIELSAMNENDDDKFPVSRANLEKLKEKRDHYRQTRSINIAEAQDLREELRRLWARIKRNPKDLENILVKRNGYSKTVIDKLKSEVKECKIIRKKMLKEIIEGTRQELEELWHKCCVSDFERNLFDAFKADVYTEDILTLHEMEIEKWETFYNKYNQIYNLIDNRKTLWDRLEQLENLAKDPNRLFTNRGGQLLLEEKERKTIQKDLPKLENKLKSKIKEFMEIEGKTFLIYGENVLDIIQRDWDEKNAQKENEKLARKIANLKTIETESKLGAKPTLSAKKRKLGASQTQLSRKMQRTNASSTIIQSNQGRGNHQQTCQGAMLVTRTPSRAVSTPDISTISSVASYNTFQENLDPRTPKQIITASTPASTNKTKTPSRLRIPMITRNKK